MMLQMDAHNLVALADLLKRAPDIAQAVMMEAQVRATTQLHRGLTAKGVQPEGSTGNLAKSIGFRQEWRDNAAIGEVSTSSPYAFYVEVGTKPHTPPIQPLIDWALAVLPGVDEEQEAKRAAFAIAWKITKRGTKPNPIWKRTWEREKPVIEGIFEYVPEHILDRIDAAGGIQ